MVNKNYSGSALLAVSIAMSILLTFLSTVYTSTNQVRTTLSRTSRTYQAVTLGNGMINYAVEKYRKTSNYTGEFNYTTDTGVSDISVAPNAGPGNATVIRVQSYVPNKTAPNRLCKAFRVQVDTSPEKKIIKGSYEELLNCNLPPTLSITEPGGGNDIVTQGEPYTIQFALHDADNPQNVRAAFYYDTDNTGYEINGNTNRLCDNKQITDTSCQWNTNGLTPGNYYVFGIVTDGVNFETKSYSNTPLQVLAPTGGATPTNQPPAFSFSHPIGNDDQVQRGGDVSIQFTFNDIDGPTPDLDLYYDTNNTGFDGIAINDTATIGNCQNIGISPSVQSCSFKTASINTGTYYFYGKANDGINAEQRSYSGALTITPPPALTFASTCDDLKKDNYMASNALFTTFPPNNDKLQASYTFDVNTGNTQRVRSVLGWELPVIAPNQNIVKAELDIYIDQSKPLGTSFRVYRLTQLDWVENQLTWLRYNSSTNWASTSGTSGGGGDYDTSSYASMPVTNQNGVPPLQDKVTTDITNFVQDAMKNRSGKLGLLIRAGESGGSNQQIIFRSKENGNTNKCPSVRYSYQ